MEEKYIRSPFGDIICFEDTDCPLFSSRGRSESHERRLSLTAEKHETDLQTPENKQHIYFFR